MSATPVVQRLLFPIAAQFVAGDSIPDALRAVERLRDDGIIATVDALGEDVVSPEDADRTRDEYLRLIEGISHRQLIANISIKLSALGTKLGDGGVLQRYAQIVNAASQVLLDPFVRVDMEGSATVDETLTAVERTFAVHSNTGPVLQAYLNRTARDIETTLRLGMRTRLCKGAYREPPEVAMHDADAIRRNYLRCAKRLLEGGRFPAFATHDPAIIDRIRETVDLAGISKSAFEFQLLYGVRTDLQRALVSDGYRVRVYVPYGSHWAKYFRRRVMERRENLVFALRSVVSRDKRR